MAPKRSARPPKAAGIAVALVVAVAVLLIFGPLVAIRLVGGDHYTIPSTSMAPTLVPGDWVLARPVGDDLPARGTVVMFEHPQRPGVIYAKRLIAFAGETVQMRGGVVYIDGQPAGMERLADRVVPMRPQGRLPALPRCRNAAVAEGDDCRQERWRETLPDGTSEVVLNVAGEIGDAAEGGPSGLDDTPVFTVPEGHVFLLGDHRDNAIDSRFPDLGMVPVENLRHIAWMVHSSFDRSGVVPRPHFGRFFTRIR
jgi:signal peptidase I